MLIAFGVLDETLLGRRVQATDYIPGFAGTYTQPPTEGVIRAAWAHQSALMLTIERGDGKLLDYQARQCTLLPQPDSTPVPICSGCDQPDAHCTCPPVPVLAPRMPRP